MGICTSSQNNIPNYVFDFPIINADIKQFYKFEKKPFAFGKFGALYKIYKLGDPTKVYACKTIVKTEENYKQIQNEISILGRLNHPNIIKMYEAYEDELFFHIITEYVVGQTLNDFFSKSCDMKKERHILEIIKQILKAVQYLHAKGVCHKDIKPENILIYSSEKNEIQVKIVDFGLSECFFQTSNRNIKFKKMTNIAGTPFFMAPEMILRKKYSQKIDSWSIGIIIYMILTKKSFFDHFECELYSHYSDPSLEEKIECQLEDEKLKEFPKIHSLLKKLLQKNPKKRISAEKAYYLFNKNVYRAE